MSDRQDQRVAAGGIAIQSSGDTTINGGVSPDQMQQIIRVVSEQVPVYAAIAREIVEARLVGFEERIMERFAIDSDTRREAFKDPDFQYLLGRAQHAFARSGEEEVGDLLVDLIAERSKSEKRDRLALTLNQAVEVAATLTINEFAELAVNYIFAHTRALNALTLDQFYEVLTKRIEPFIDDISTNSSSYAYIEAQRCGNVGILAADFYDIIKTNYAGFLFLGKTKAEFSLNFPEINVSDADLFIPCLHDSEKIQPKTICLEVWSPTCGDKGIGQDRAKQIWDFFSASLFTKDQAVDFLGRKVPRFEEMVKIWDDSKLGTLQLTTVGIAIGHAYASTRGFSAPITTWIN